MNKNEFIQKMPSASVNFFDLQNLSKKKKKFFLIYRTILWKIKISDFLLRQRGTFAQRTMFSMGNINLT